MKKVFKYSRLCPELEIKDTKKYGLGVFAKENIEKDRVIYILSGKKMDINDLIESVNSGKENIDDPFQIGKKTYIDLDDTSRTFNHSCEPSAGVRKIGEMFALKNIKKGEEITYDYSLTIAPTVWKMKCKCGTKNCRKILGDVLTIPKVRLKQYINKGALQNYMKLLLGRISEKGKYVMPKYEVLALKKLKHTHVQ